MTLAIRIHELVDAILLAGGGSSERLDRLDLHGRLDQEQLRGWAEVLAALPAVGVDSVSAIDALGDQVDLATAAAELVGQELRIQVSKFSSPTTAFCLTTDGIGAVFADYEVSSLVRQVWVACDFDRFKTESCRIDPWTDDASEAEAEDEEARVPDPRRLVKDFVGGRVPKSISPYLLTSGEPVPSKVFDKWKDLAVVRLLHSLVNEVISTGGEEVVITGTRPRKIESNLNSPYSAELFTAATEAARWVYASGRDVDTRFALFTYELSREWPDALNFKDGFAARGVLSLEAAKTAFRAHVQETSKDTLKSLGDLRKTLSEEVTKVVAQTRDLLGTMWRDFMIAATVFLGRIVLLGSDKPLSNPGPLRALLSGAVIFLVLSLFLSLRTNAKFMSISSASLSEWRRKLYGFMNDDDFNKLANVPLEESTREYKRVVRWVAAAYVVVIACLLWTAWGGNAKQSAGSLLGTLQGTAASTPPASVTSAASAASATAATAATAANGTISTQTPSAAFPRNTGLSTLPPASGKPNANGH
ncbi:hypothetical protein [Limnohabitans sp. DM1]|uniref:hypothetical protein n=1 Tax=Limnohabitans sp. DM1 TaxID=1597955 RepID=UPI000AEEAEAB|nr:hypothetical protein [Limnohabitans sp. DM1]